MVLGIWRDYPKIEEEARRVRFENLRIGLTTAAQPTPDAPFLSGLTAFLEFTRTKPSEGMTVADLKAMENVVKRYPYAGSIAKLSWAWALNGRLPEAIEMFKKIRYVHGDVLYHRIRNDMHQRVVDGQIGLRALDDAVQD